MYHRQKIQRSIRRRKRGSGDSEEVVQQHKINPHDLSPQNIPHLQRTLGNRTVQRLLAEQQHSEQDGQVQRTPSYAAYKKSTAALGPRNHIRTLDLAYKAYKQDEARLNGNQKLARMRKLVELCEAYLGDSKRQASKRRNGVLELKRQLLEEINHISQPMQGGEFNPTNETQSQNGVMGGQMNSLDVVKYNFGIEQQVGDDGTVTDHTVEGGEFEGVFKKTQDTANIKGTRGDWTGIQGDDPRMTERSIATYEVAKLLDPSLIPPTFYASHQREGEQVDGFIMQKVKGVSGSDKVDRPEERGKMLAVERYKTDPVFRRAMSNLVLLDFICGQVDRHAGNYMIQLGEDGKVKGVVGIDNDLAFGDKFTDMTYGGHARNIPGDAMFRQFINAGGNVANMQEIDRRFAERIIALAQNTNLLSNALANLLSPTEVQAAVSRLTSLANFLQPLINTNSPIIKTKWE